MPFAPILDELLARAAPWGRAAVFCDGEGERVAARFADGAARDAFALDVAGASAAWIARATGRGFGAATLRVVGETGSVHVRPMTDGYYVVLLAGRAAPPTPLAAALDVCVRDLTAHM